MPLPFYPRMGHVLVCDFKGFQEPEMCKVRPVIVVSPRIPYRDEIVAVVPISLTEPRNKRASIYRLSKNYHPSEPDDLPCWAICDMVLNIGRARLEGFKVGRRKWEFPQLTGDDLLAVRYSTRAGLALDRLPPPPETPI